MEDVFKKHIPDLKSVDDVTPKQFRDIMWNAGERWDKTPAKEWEFYGFKRGPDGKFNDTELAELIKNCIEEPAHAFGAHGSPASLKRVEIMGMLQARNVFNVCTLNE
jgi:hypothetical protein